jgi:hypothetical protein
MGSEKENAAVEKRRVGGARGRFRATSPVLISNCNPNIQQTRKFVRDRGARNQRRREREEGLNLD